MNVFVISVLLFGFCAFLVGLIIFAKRRDLLGSLWLAFNTLCGIWATGYAFQINNDVDYETALLMTRISDAAAIFIPVTWYHFVLKFNHLSVSKKWLATFYGIAGIIFLFSPTTLFIKDLKDKSSIGLLHFANHGVAFGVFTLFYSFTVLNAFSVLVKSYRKKDITEERKKQIRFLLAGAVLGFGGGSTAFLPVYDVDLPVQYGTLIAPLFPIITALAFSHYRLLDIDQMAQRIHQDRLAALGTITASINHEIKSPLYIIQGLSENFLSAVQKSAETEKSNLVHKARETAEKVMAQAERAMDIMKRFTAFSKADLENQVRCSMIKVTDVLDGIEPLLRYEFEQQGIRFVKEGVESATVYADSRFLEEIFFNLILNAVQALKNVAREKQIKINSRTQEGKIIFEIEDNGPGIAPDHISEIFEPFYTTRTEGTGLGLYITKQLVVKNKGTVKVESEQSRGTKFILEFLSASPQKI